MTEQQKAWYEVGKSMGKKSSDQHPEQIIQEDWNQGQSCNASYCYGGFNNWLKISKSWASGVRKGSQYFENN